MTFEQTVRVLDTRRIGDLTIGDLKTIVAGALVTETPAGGANVVDALLRIAGSIDGLAEAVTKLAEAQAYGQPK